MTSEEAKQALRNLGWSEFNIEMSIRANFYCEYCGKYLLESIHTYDSWQNDYINPNGESDLSNMAVSCKVCNFAKRRTDPSEGIVNPSRGALIESSKRIIQERPNRKKDVLQHTKEAALVLIGCIEPT